MKATRWLPSIVLSAAGLAAQPSAPSAIQAQIVATKIEGEVWLVTDKGKMALRGKDHVEQGATVTTGEKSSAVLVFSNGTVASLAAGTEMQVEQFLQDPFPATIKVSELNAEPTVSKLKLHFVRGELLVHVIRLNHGGGSQLVFVTPAGFASPRGTTLRMRTTPMGPDTAEFLLELIEGNITMMPKGGGLPVVVVPGKPYKATIPWKP